jgi:type II secretion system protein N
MEKLILALKFAYSHKSKLFITILSALVFIFVLFPFNDISDLASSKIAELSHNQLLVSFENLKLGLFPSPEVDMDQVSIDIANMPTLKAQSLSVSPSPSILWSRTPSGSLNAKGLFKGEVDISIQKAGKSDSGIERQKITMKAEKVSLAEIREFARLPVLLKGQLTMSTTATGDLAFQEQPDMDLTVSIAQFELPSGNVQTAMGPLTLPDLKLSSVVLKGKLSQGRFNIEEGLVGVDGDELRGTIKGGIGFQIQNQGGFNPVIGAYTIDVDMDVKKGFQDKAALFLSFLDQHKTQTADGAHFKFRLSANNTSVPPNISALR